VTLESYLEEVKISLANIQVRRPKGNLPHRERRVLKDSTHNKNILPKKAGTGNSNRHNEQTRQNQGGPDST